MIDCKNLRIGNWVYDGERTQFPMYVRAVGEDYVYLDFEDNEGDLWESEPKDLNGIPLTKELLKKIGFSYNEHGIWKLSNYREREISICIEREFVAIEAYRNLLCDSRCTCHGIKYLHQLQNLFYEISRTEFKIEL